MRTLLLIILLSFTCQAQTLGDIWRKIPDDAKHHYAAAGTAVAVGIGVHKIFKIESPLFCGALGFGAGWGVTDLKEFWWDGKLGKGVKSQIDRNDGHWGATCGGFYVSVVYTIRNHNQAELDTLNFQFKQLQAKDTIK